mmetsp:Transcript_27203/g.73088  ORF Transcript_27203/g.73088 Transcript_27203/m.73088 type:complete len:324 (+) Transcript_27203:454-1425(+)
MPIVPPLDAGEAERHRSLALYVQLDAQLHAHREHRAPPAHAALPALQRARSSKTRGREETLYGRQPLRVCGQALQLGARVANRLVVVVVLAAEARQKADPAARRAAGAHQAPAERRRARDVIDGRGGEWQRGEAARPGGRDGDVFGAVKVGEGEALRHGRRRRRRRWCRRTDDRFDAWARRRLRLGLWRARAHVGLGGLDERMQRPERIRRQRIQLHLALVRQHARVSEHAHDLSEARAVALLDAANGGAQLAQLLRRHLSRLREGRALRCSDCSLQRVKRQRAGAGSCLRLRLRLRLLACPPEARNLEKAGGERHVRTGGGG